MTEPEMFDRMRSLDDVERYSYAEKGQICLTVKNMLLHQQRINPHTDQPCSLTEWIHLVAPWGYATCFAAMRDCEALRDIPPQDLAEIPSANFPIIRQLSTAVRSQPSVLFAAKSLRADALIEHVKQHHPDQHVESRKAFRIVLDESQSAEVEEAIAISMERGAMSRAEALVDICTNYRADVLLDELSKETAK